MTRIVIFANGLLQQPQRALSLIRADDIILCADGGLHLAWALGLQPQTVIGDLDSISEADRARIDGAGIAVRQYPIDKDQTDLELSLQVALEQRPSAVLIIGALGGRLDQTLANLSLLTHPELGTVDCRLDDGLEQVILCSSHTEIRGSPGDLVSLLPWGAPVAGISTTGLKWPLVRETLYPEKTQGISNEMLGDAAAVYIESGLLLIVHRRQSQADIRRSETMN
jgi:thiamine pyrophosphokinase